MELQIDRLHNKAVNAALKKNWDEAIRLNQQILDIDEENIDALLALSYAYMEQDDLKKAKKHYRHALKIDPANVIARNNIDKINILLKKGETQDKHDDDDIQLTTDTFINIKGKTRVVTLMNIGQADVLAKLKVGKRVILQAKKRRLEVRNKKGEYIGCLPDDVSKRLLFFLDAGSEYLVLVKSSTKNSVDIFIREESKGKKVQNYISFPDNIQDDMKMFMGKEDEDPDNHDDDETDNKDDDDDEDDEEIVDDIEKLAENSGHEKEEYFGIDTSDHDEDDDE